MFCVFFFKQKTAYEMRISGWSSDVGSSDLARGEGARRLALVLSLDDEARGKTDAGRLHADAELLRPRLGIGNLLDLQFVKRLPVAHQDKLGRATCRERVCQYV